MTNILDELRWRGLIYDIIDEENLRKRLARPITVYCGFDPTADSMHIGNLLPIVTLLRFHKAGHKIIFLTGGGTGMVGDPSGKDSARSLNPEQTVIAWANRFKEQFGRLVHLDNRRALCLDNAEWLKSLKAIDMWRDYGRHFNINYMLAKDSVKSRIDQGLSYLEFSYMIMQSIDFLNLHEKYGCDMQIGGRDQWGNITAGMELIRKVLGSNEEVFGLTLPLILRCDGRKYGKTEQGTVWLDAEKTSPYQMYQFFYNTPDADVIGLLKYYTFLPEAEIAELAELVANEPHKRAAQIKLAEEVVRLVHGEAALHRAQAITEALFSGAVAQLSLAEIQDALSGVPSAETAEDLDLVGALVLTGLAQSRREARQFIENGAVLVNGTVQTALDFVCCKSAALEGKAIVLRRGKKNYALLTFK